MENDKSKFMQAVKVAYSAIDDKMGEEIVVLDIHEVSIISDFFIIASAKNSNQLKAMAESVQEKLAQLGIRPRHIEGVQSARWILLDFGYIIVHLFCKEEREYYRLDRLWGDAVQILPEELI
ncbi:MAG: ribosome silencing factor [Defluviitaleaceae bacterium]|nr:ribosome silencing factor [Defluviitaleaceae bacterium]